MAERLLDTTKTSSRVETMADSVSLATLRAYDNHDSMRHNFFTRVLCHEKVRAAN